MPTNSNMPERCDWNPKFNIPATDPVEDGGCANVAVWSVGVRSNWHLCDSCAGLAEFKRMTARVRLAGRKTDMGDEFAYVPVCSFCKRSVKDVTYLVEASENNHSVYICDQCIGICNQMVFSEIRRQPEQDNTETELPSPLPRSRL